MSLCRIATARRWEVLDGSIIREFTQRGKDAGAINLGQGHPQQFSPEGMEDDARNETYDPSAKNYPDRRGMPELREAIADKMRRWYGLSVNPVTEVSVTCGATAGIACAIGAMVDPGDEVVIPTPFYQNHDSGGKMWGAVSRYVTMQPDGQRWDGSGTPTSWQLDLGELAKSFNNRTKVIVVNSPHNPTGKVFTREELEAIAHLCEQWGTVAVTDEIYEHMLFQGKHVPLATVPGMEDRTVTISGVSKTYGVPAWRIGWAIGPENITDVIRKIHDNGPINPPPFLQRGVAPALYRTDEYCGKLPDQYADRRDFLLRALTRAGFSCTNPQGAYYTMADYSKVPKPPDLDTDLKVAEWLIHDPGVIGIPGSAFSPKESVATGWLRFSFSTTMDNLEKAAERLAKLER